jgi:hypothetical protein
MRLGDVDRQTAEQALRASDLSRETYVRHWYRFDPGDPGLYHLVIDSISPDTCVELIALAVVSKPPSRSAGSRD